jgi:ring-1,2-phenylacetyl-CoA epoxidase subunit PaaC
VSLRSLVRSLADNKQLLGMRYAEWCIAAPSLEADIAAAAMGLDDLGHSRVLFGCLNELSGSEGEDSNGAANVAYLDRPWTDWTQFIAANAVLDSAFTLMIEAMAGGSVEVLRTRLRKMLQEERYHFLHGRSWMHEAPADRPIQQAWREAIEWFGPEGGDVDELRSGGVLSLSVKDLRVRLEERLGAKEPKVTIEWARWDPARRRTSDGQIDEPTLEMIRGLAERRYMPGG